MMRSCEKLVLISAECPRMIFQAFITVHLVPARMHCIILFLVITIKSTVVRNNNDNNNIRFIILTRVVRGTKFGKIRTADRSSVALRTAVGGSAPRTAEQRTFCTITAELLFLYASRRCPAALLTC
jgi:hypothetical protein